MAKRSPRLIFTDEEKAAPELKKAVKKAGKKLDKLNKAETKIPKKTVKTKLRAADPETGKITARVFFEEAEKKRPVSTHAHAAANAPLDALRCGIHRRVREDSGGNAGADAANTLSEGAENAVRAIETAHHSHLEKPYKKAEKAEAAADKANLKALNRQYEQEYGKASNPYSKWQQKRAIKKEYAAKAGGQTGVKASEATARAAKRSAQESKKAGAFIARHKKGLLIAGGMALLLTLIAGGFSSCSVLFQSASSAVAASTYPSKDEDMLGAEAAYAAKEAELQEYLDGYERAHDYDEYHYDLDDIEHDPYVLISAVTALMGRGWTLDEVGGILDALFEKQYILTETVTAETRYRTEARTGIRYVTDPDTGGSYPEEYEYDVQVPYTYYICTVALENFNLSHVPVYIMGEEQLSLYAVYMSTLGNRPDLFPRGLYPHASVRREYLDYDVPPEALEDERFAAMLKEAEKYLGFPYVWGGSNPSTSFDCSGFVSWVVNHSGWDVGRLSAQGLCDICTPVPPASAMPGDLVFFMGTYDTPEVSHVGIYVGNGMMLHCGSPVSYTNLNSSYWQAHFYLYGRLPEP